MMPSSSESYPSNTTGHKQLFAYRTEGQTAKLSLLIPFEDMDADYKLLKTDETISVKIIGVKDFVKDDVVADFEIRDTFRVCGSVDCRAQSHGIVLEFYRCKTSELFVQRFESGLVI